MRCASRREQPVSLRRHYPHQVLSLIHIYFVKVEIEHEAKYLLPDHEALLGQLFRGLDGLLVVRQQVLRFVLDLHLHEVRLAHLARETCDAHRLKMCLRDRLKGTDTLEIVTFVQGG